jgi:hypothetical protein
LGGFHESVARSLETSEISSGPVGGSGGATTFTFKGILHEPESLATLIEYFPASSRSTSENQFFDQ